MQRLALQAIPVSFREAARDLTTLAARFDGRPPAPRSWAAWASWDWQPPCLWVAGRLAAFQAALTHPEAARAWCRQAVAHATWVFSALYALRNRRAHEAWWPDAGDEIMQTRLEMAVNVLAEALVTERDAEGRWHARGPLFFALLATNSATGKKADQASKVHGTPLNPADLLTHLQVALPATPSGPPDAPSPG